MTITPYYLSANFPLNADACPKQARAIIEMEALPKEEISVRVRSFLQPDNLIWKVIGGVAILGVFVMVCGLYLVFRRSDPEESQRLARKLSTTIFFNPFIRAALVMFLSGSMLGVSALLPTYNRVFTYEYDEVTTVHLILRWVCLLICVAVILATYRTL